jgi:ribosomal protein S18 acetylase RimI-like enzyme
MSGYPVAMKTEVEIGIGGAALCEQLFEPLCALYEEIFSEPPMHWTPGQPDEHRETLRRLMQDAGFKLVTATDESGLIGFAYGRTLQPDTKWWENFLIPVPLDITSERLNRTFAVIDFGVRRSRRRQGIGRKILDALLGGRHEERATLAVEPEAIESQNFYRHLGWKYVGRLRGAPGDTAPLFDIYAIDLVGSNP